MYIMTLGNGMVCVKNKLHWLSQCLRWKILYIDSISNGLRASLDTIYQGHVCKKYIAWFMADQYFSNGILGAQLKLKCPNISAYTDREELYPEDRRISKVITTCGRILSQYNNVSPGSHL